MNTRTLPEARVVPVSLTLGEIQSLRDAAAHAIANEREPRTTVERLAAINLRHATQKLYVAADAAVELDTEYSPAAEVVL